MPAPDRGASEENRPGPYPHGLRGRFSNMIPLSIFLYTEMIAAAVLALWVAKRWPQLGPKSIVAALAAVLVALFLGNFVSIAVAAAVKLPFGIYAALIGCILPGFFSIFLAGAWLIRSVLGVNGGGSGGTGHGVRA